MITHSILAAAAALTLAAGSDPAQVNSTATGAGPASQGPGARGHKEFTDRHGNKFAFDVDDAGKVVKASVKDRDDKPKEFVEIPLSSMSICIPASAVAPSGAKPAKPPKPLCQGVASISEGSFIQMGTATCYCCVIGGTGYCFGNTCR